MAQLTKSLRERMCRRVLNNAFSEKIDELKRVQVQLADKIYNDIYGAHLKTMNSLPKGYFKSQGYLYISIAGQEHYLSFSESKIVAHNHDKRDKAKLYVGDEPVAIEWLKAVGDLENLQKKRSEMEYEVEALLASVTTFKKLWQVWPECKSLLEDFESKPTVALLPSIQVKKLNAALGLPVETQEAETV